MKKTALLLALLAFAPVAHVYAQETGRWETRLVSETTPGHWENRSKQVWHEPSVEIQSRKTDDGKVEHVKVETPGYWQTVTERVWVEARTTKVEKKVWVAAQAPHVNPWDDTPKSDPTATGRTEEPTTTPPSQRTEQPATPKASAPAPRPAAAPAPRTLPFPSDKVETDPFVIIGGSSGGQARPTERPVNPYATADSDRVTPAFEPTRVTEVQRAAPEPAQTYVVYAPSPPPAERVVVVRQPSPAPRVVYVQQPSARVYVNDCWPNRYYDNYGYGYGSRRSSYYDDCGPRVRVGVGLGVGVGVRIGRRGGVGLRFGF